MKPPRARLAALALLLATACSLPGWITRPFVGRDRDAESEATSLMGEEERALDLMREIVRGRQWPAFGHLAAEADLAREAAR